jgi:hypothetical protein
VPRARAERPSTAFADSLTSDLDAVTRGLTTRWNSGPIEGRVKHIKMLKRQMFGRASLPLLRKRVLLTASRCGPTVPSHPRMSAGGGHVRAPRPSAQVWVR